MSDRPLDHQGDEPSSTTTTLEADNPERPWTPKTIANSILESISRTCKWQKDEMSEEFYTNIENIENIGESNDMQEKPNANKGKRNENEIQHGEHTTHQDGAPEYTVEHLQKALIDLRTSNKSLTGIECVAVEKTDEKTDENIDILKESKETNSYIPESFDIELSTEISYPANQLQVHENLTIQPDVENISTQSTADRVRLSIQTTTEDLPKPLQEPQQLGPVAPSINQKLQTDKADSERDRPLKKSKVPILIRDYTNASATSINIEHNKGKQLSSSSGSASRIPQRIPNLTAKEEVCASRSIHRTPSLRTTNLIHLTRSHLKICENKFDEENKENNEAKERKASKETKESTEVKEQQENSESLANENKVIFKMATDIQQQTDVLPPCKAYPEENILKSIEINYPNEIKRNNEVKIEESCEQIEIVESVLDEWPQDGIGHATNNQTNAQIEVKTDHKSEEEKSETTEPIVDSTMNHLPDSSKTSEENDDDYEDYEDDDDIAEIKNIANNKNTFSKNSLRRESKTCIINTTTNGGDKEFIDELNKSIGKQENEIKENLVVDTTTGAISESTTEVKTKPEQKIQPHTTENQDKMNFKNKIKQQLNFSNWPMTKEELAYEVNVFNMIQSQKVNNILRLAMPHNQILLPIFVASPSTILYSLELELNTTLAIKKKASYYINDLAEQIRELPSLQQLNLFYQKNEKFAKEAKSKLTHDNKPSTNAKTLNNIQNCSYYGNGSQIIGQPRATFAKPPFYYGAYKPIPPK